MQADPAASPFNLLYQTPLCCHPSRKRSLKQIPQNICSYFFSCLLLHVFPRGPIKSLPCSCFLYKSRDELQLIKRKLRGHPEVLGCDCGSGSGSSSGEEYRVIHTPGEYLIPVNTAWPAEDMLCKNPSRMLCSL